ncbi:MAG: response regulator, partial [Thermoanaerobaculia bacterium]|nr:response regulator [Thermoanaerobaculia bacterium]
MSSRPLALLVDDEAGILETLAGVLGDQGFRILSTTSGEEAVDLYRRELPDVVFLDVWLPDRDGIETLALLREFDPAAAVVMLSGHGTTSTAVRAIRMGAHDYLEKPPSYEQVVGAPARVQAEPVEHRRAPALGAPRLRRHQPAGQGPRRGASARWFGRRVLPHVRRDRPRGA